MKAVTLDDAKKFHDQFYGADSGVFAVVGPVDVKAVTAVATELLGNWNSPMKYKPIVAQYKAVVAMNQKIETPDKANAQFEAGIRLKVSQNDPDYPAMVLAGYMFGVPITSHIADRIRNREGLSYGANARVTVPAEGDSAILTGTVSLNPMNGPKVEFSFKDELAKTLKEGFNAAEVTEAKKAYLDSLQVSRSQDAALLTLLASHEQLSHTMDWDDQLEKKIAALTPAQISDAFRRHVDPAALTIVKAGILKPLACFSKRQGRGNGSFGICEPRGGPPIPGRCEGRHCTGARGVNRAHCSRATQRAVSSNRLAARFRSIRAPKVFGPDAGVRPAVARGGARE